MAGIGQPIHGTVLVQFVVLLLTIAGLWTGRQLSRAEGGVFALSEPLRWILNLLG